MPSILLVEDDAGIRNAYAFGLSKAGFEVTTATSGAEALIRVEDAHFDLILLDLLMMGMSGLDFLREYDVKTKSPGTKVVALSNMDSSGTHERATALGVVDYLDKSAYEPMQLVDYVKGILKS